MLTLSLDDVASGSDTVRLSLQQLAGLLEGFQLRLLTASVQLGADTCQNFLLVLAKYLPLIRRLVQAHRSLRSTRRVAESVDRDPPDDHPPIRERRIIESLFFVEFDG